MAGMAAVMEKIPHPVGMTLAQIARWTCAGRASGGGGT
jgi:hypothetical protein